MPLPYRYGAPAKMGGSPFRRGGASRCARFNITGPSCRPCGCGRFPNRPYEGHKTVVRDVGGMARTSGPDACSGADGHNDRGPTMTRWRAGRARYLQERRRSERNARDSGVGADRDVPVSLWRATGGSGVSRHESLKPIDFHTLLWCYSQNCPEGYALFRVTLTVETLPKEELPLRKSRRDGLSPVFSAHSRHLSILRVAGMNHRQGGHATG